MTSISDELLEVYAQRIRVQGPGHIATVATLWNLVQARREEAADFPADVAADVPVPADLPDEIDPGSVRLDGDHAETLADLLTLALDLQVRETDRHGTDHPRALLASCLLAHALAVADQMDGHAEGAAILVTVSSEGLLELAEQGPEVVRSDEVEVAQALRDWIIDRFDPP